MILNFATVRAFVLSSPLRDGHKNADLQKAQTHAGETLEYRARAHNHEYSIDSDM